MRKARPMRTRKPEYRPIAMDERNKYRELADMYLQNAGEALRTGKGIEAVIRLLQKSSDYAIRACGGNA
jgi:hypothetical protein